MGGTLGMALGVHIGNGRRANLALDFLTASAVWGAGVGLVFLLEEFKEGATTQEQEELKEGQAVILLAIPVVQAGRNRSGRANDGPIKRKTPADCVACDTDG